MRNFIGSSNHPESYLTASTTKNMIEAHKKLDLTHIAIADNGLMTGTLKAYNMCNDKKKGYNIKPILGVELFFKDKNCTLLNQRSKYYKTILYAIDQEAYQALVKLNSKQTKYTVIVDEREYQLYDWEDLFEIAKFNVVCVSSNIEDIVSKHVVLGQESVAEELYVKLHNLFKDRYYPSIIPTTFDKIWSQMIEFTVQTKDGEKSAKISANSDLDIVIWYNEARDLKKIKAYNLHNYVGATISNVYIDGIKRKINKRVLSASLKKEFVELTQGDLQVKANKFLLQMAKKYGDTVLLSNYSYYSKKDEKIVQDVRLEGSKSIAQYQYIASTDEVFPFLVEKMGLTEKEIDNLVENTHMWASLFDNFKLQYSWRLPIDPLNPKNPEQTLLDAVKRVGRMDWKNKEYVTRFRKEWETLVNNGTINLAGYFVPLINIYKLYEDNKELTGPGRGSAGGSLLAYLIGITHVDPIKYNLSFERFLTLDRIKQNVLPDIDVDLPSRELLYHKNGRDGYLDMAYSGKYAAVSTRGLIRLKSAIKDVNRFVNGSVDKSIEEFTKTLPAATQGVNDYDFIYGYNDADDNYVPGILESSEELQNYAIERKTEWEIVQKAVSVTRQYSRHSCAVVIADQNITDIIPTFKVGDFELVTQPEHKECESAGLIKYDFLGLNSLNDINGCLKYLAIKNNEEYKVGYFNDKGHTRFIWDLPFDEGVYKDISAGRTETVFQLNTMSVIPYLRKIHPRSIVDLAVITSAVRPGPLNFIDENTGKNMVDEYTDRRFGRSVGDIPILNELLPETYGVIIFQENLSKIAKELGGMDVEQAENVRIAMSKKKIKEMLALKDIFIEGASKKVPVQQAEKIWTIMSKFAEYGFNCSHATTYVITSYACSYLKHHYPLEWWASVLSNADNKEINEVFYKYVKDIILPPDINVSTEKLVIDYSINKIRSKLSTIAGVGDKTVEKIMNNRPFKDLEDFVRKDVCGQSIIRKLILIGVMDSFFKVGLTIQEKMLEFDRVNKKITYEEKLQEYDKKIAEGNVKSIKLKEAFINRGIPLPEVDLTYVGITPVQLFQMKKEILPTMTLDLDSTILEGNRQTLKRGDVTYYIDKYGQEFPILTGTRLKNFDEIQIEKDYYVACAGYVIGTKKFTYKNNTRTALKLVIDSSGYICEKVMWPDYNTGVLEYPTEIQKGSVCWFIYKKRKDKKEQTSIVNIIIETA